MAYRKSIIRKRIEGKRIHYAAMRKAKAAKREAEVNPAMYAMTVRVYRIGVVRQVIQHTDGLYVWHEGGKTRTYEAFCKAMNRKLWSRAKETLRRQNRGEEINERM